MKAKVSHREKLRITYNSTNRAHHFDLAESLHLKGALYQFITAYFRFSKHVQKKSFGTKIKFADLYQFVYVILRRYLVPHSVSSCVAKLSLKLLDSKSYKYAKESDIFIFYRSAGLETMKRVKKKNIPTVMVMEEVNSHVDNYIRELARESGDSIKTIKDSIPDYQERIECYKLADFILCPSTYVYNSFVNEGVKQEKLIKITYGINSKHVLGKSTLKEANKFVVLFVGQLHYRKGLKYGIEAFDKLNYKNKELIIVGPMTNQPGIDTTRLNKRDITYRGVLKGLELSKAYANASILLMPTIEDGFGLVITEAMSHGTAVITTSHSIGADLICNGKDGFIVAPRDSNAILNVFNRVAADAELLNEVSKNALKKSQSFQNWDSYATTLIDTVEQILVDNAKKY